MTQEKPPEGTPGLLEPAQQERGTVGWLLACVLADDLSEVSKEDLALLCACLYNTGAMQRRLLFGLLRTQAPGGKNAAAIHSAMEAYRRMLLAGPRVWLGPRHTPGTPEFLAMRTISANIARKAQQALEDLRKPTPAEASPSAADEPPEPPAADEPPEDPQA